MKRYSHFLLLFTIAFLLQNLICCHRAPNKNPDLENESFENLPEKEFTQKFLNKYSSAGHPKALGLDIVFSVPLSWEQKEGERPHIVQKFVNKDEGGVDMIMLIINDLEMEEDYEPDEQELKEFFSKDNLKDMIPKDSRLIDCRRIVLDGIISGQTIYVTEGRRMDRLIVTKTISYSTYFKGKIIQLQCSSAPNVKRLLDKRFSQMQPVYYRVANSMIFMDKWNY